MIKRFTLLRRNPALSVAEFREHWAVPHAKIATGFEGLMRYNQNRVDAVCWATGGANYDMDGLVELWFDTQDSVDRNAMSETTQKLIVDEPTFLSGLTAMRVDTPCDLPDGPSGAKTVVLARVADREALSRALEDLLAGTAFTCEAATLSFTRKALWAEPSPPDTVVTIWSADEALQGNVRAVFENNATEAMCFTVDELRIV